jgi:hypothetical protein
MNPGRDTTLKKVQDHHFVGLIRIQQDTTTAKDYTYQILETVEEFKQEISDSNYKTVVDLLKKIHNL